jgi:hypothetical protein
VIEVSKSEQWFCSADAAMAAGWRRRSGKGEISMRQLMRSVILVILVLAVSRPAPATAQPSSPRVQNRLVVFEAFMRST